ncbi:MAG TPA: hypothetical protein VEZ90_17980, partial [Blastocatellia bacterium]|nr:hypothetical protein [Blastocatellia bacterium]
TSVPGLFAAGDVTGRYSSTLMALGDGVCAGFSGYRWAFRAKFGAEPRLFAYRASEDVIYPNPTDLPPISLRSRPRLLGHEQEFHALLKKHGMSHLACSGLSAMLSGRVMLVNMAENVGCDIEDLRQLVRNACAARLMTVHIVSDLRGTSADRNLVKDFQTCEEPADGGDYVWASG